MSLCTTTLVESKIRVWGRSTTPIGIKTNVGRHGEVIVVVWRWVPTHNVISRIWWWTPIGVIVSRGRIGAPTQICVTCGICRGWEVWWFWFCAFKRHFKVYKFFMEFAEGDRVVPSFNNAYEFFVFNTKAIKNFLCEIIFINRCTKDGKFIGPSFYGLEKIYNALRTLWQILKMTFHLL